MKYSTFKFENAVEGILIKRYKRFLADIEVKTSDILDVYQNDSSILNISASNQNQKETIQNIQNTHNTDNKTTIITVHCPNSGAMTGIKTPGIKVWLTPITSKAAKLKFRWQLATIKTTDNNTLNIGVDTHLPNKLINFYLEKQELDFCKEYTIIKREVPYDTNSKIDFLLTNPVTKKRMFLEIKNVHMSRTNKIVEFPDGVTARGSKHMMALARQKQIDFDNTRCVVLYLIQRSDPDSFQIAKDIDKVYFEKAQEAKNAGVEFMAFTSQINENGITLLKQIII